MKTEKKKIILIFQRHIFIVFSVNDFDHIINANIAQSIKITRKEEEDKEVKKNSI